MDRRSFLIDTTAIAVAGAADMAAASDAPGWIAQRPAVRVIVDNDFAGDPDGLIALGREAALCEHIDARGLFADMWAHFKLNARRGKD